MKTTVHNQKILSNKVKHVGWFKIDRWGDFQSWNPFKSGPMEATWHIALSSNVAWFTWNDLWVGHPGVL